MRFKHKRIDVRYIAQLTLSVFLCNGNASHHIPAAYLIQGGLKGNKYLKIIINEG